MMKGARFSRLLTRWAKIYIASDWIMKNFPGGWA